MKPVSNNPTLRETVPDGHNIVDSGFAVGHDSRDNKSKVVFRSEHTAGADGKYTTYLASIELTNGVWSDPIPITQPEIRQTTDECNASVITNTTVTGVARVGLELPPNVCFFTGLQVCRSSYSP